jgi:cytochrome c-type biogenesis protein CcmH
MMVSLRLSLMILALMASLADPARATEPDEILADPAREARARAITRELRCVVCQNQSVDDSEAPLAKDIRTIVRERIVAGDTDAEVRDFVVNRYGQYVLLRPPFGIDTALIWVGPFLLFGLALLVATIYLRRARTADNNASGALSEDEERRIEALLKDDNP